jgi:autotransporter strand-loop-strand O-heptosyltransferase
MPDEARPSEPVNLPYMPAVPTPTQEGPAGLRFDFNEGCRVLAPDDGRSWRVRLADLDTGNTLFETSGEFRAGLVRSAKRYFVRFRIEAWQDGELVLSHDYDARDRDVMVQFYPHTIGDGIGWFPNAVRFQQRHGCRLTCAMGEKLIPLFRDAYPQVEFVPYDAVDTGRFYASYIIGAFFDELGTTLQPTDVRLVGLHRHAAYILGLDPDEAPPRIALDDDTRPIAEPYVCIATQATGQSKYWKNPAGWPEIVRYLKECGYRVICIDQSALHGHGGSWNRIPAEAADETGDRPLQERARWLKHTDFFIGLSSGLSWLAWAGRHAGGDDQRLHSPDQRIQHALSYHQLSRLQQLLERPAAGVRARRFPALPAPQGHAAPVRMHPADHAGPREGRAAADSGIWCYGR